MIQYTRVTSLVLISAGCLLLQGCDSVKRNLGIDRDPPDEFAVSPSAHTLEMPPEQLFELPQPSPGAPRPQEVRAREERQAKLIGVRPGIKEKTSRGENTLLEKAGAQKNRDQVRQQVNQETLGETTQDKTVLQQLGIQKITPPGNVINPYAEKERLKAQEVAQQESPQTLTTDMGSPGQIITAGPRDATAGASPNEKGYFSGKRQLYYPQLEK